MNIGGSYENSIKIPNYDDLRRDALYVPRQPETWGVIVNDVKSGNLTNYGYWGRGTAYRIFEI